MFILHVSKRDEELTRQGWFCKTGNRHLSYNKKERIRQRTVPCLAEKVL